MATTLPCKRLDIFRHHARNFYHKRSSSQILSRFKSLQNERRVNFLPRKFEAVTLPLLFAQLEPFLSDVTHALKLALHLQVLHFHQGGIGVPRHKNWRGAENSHAGKGCRQQEMVPG